MFRASLYSLCCATILFGLSDGTIPPISNGCGSDGISCSQVPANGLVFDCRHAGIGGKAGNVVLLHGFPEWSDMYMPLMRVLAGKGYQSIACNQRGYSSGAAPDSVTDYNYDKLRDDVFAVATAVNYTKFHLVAHDHGAVLGWYSAGSQRGQERILSYSAMSIPHNDAFAAGLQGPTADKDQQIASQYFTMFTLKDSASIHGWFWMNILGRESGFTWSSDFQKALWWYNGAMGKGVLSMPPLMSYTELSKAGATATAGLRWIFGGTPDNGTSQTSPVGDITIPVVYICGKSDSAILCNKPFALRTKEYCKGSYEYLEVDCGHDVLSCGAESQKVIDAVVRVITRSSARIIV